MAVFATPAAIYIGVPTLALVTFYIYRKFCCHRHFKRLGIPGPEPNFLYGNLDELWVVDKRHLVIHEWSKKYGKFYGYYEGATPILVVSSPEAVEQICVKQFHTFPGRKNPLFFPDPNKFPNSPFSNIGTVWGERWKRLRTITNPGFSTGKLKNYVPLINKSQDELTKLFEDYANSGEALEAFQTFQYLALDVISEVAFGIELNSVNNRGVDNPVLPKFKRVIGLLTGEPFILKLTAMFPEVAGLLSQVMVLQMNAFSGLLAPIREMAEVAKKVISDRRENPAHRRNDLLQMLIDASTTEQTFEGNVLQPLTELEVISQVIQFFGAGTNTTSATMSYAAYVLATHPECQEKLYKEIMASFPDENTAPDYDTVMKIPYLDWFIHETIRLYPIAIMVVNRFALQNTEVCGIPLTTSANTALIDMYSIHQDSELWGPIDPAKFHPERWSPDYPTTSTRPSSAFLGFGFGPRICLGMRLALFEMKLTMVNLLRRFRVVPPEGGYPNGLEVISTVAMLPKNGVWVRVQDRVKLVEE